MFQLPVSFISDTAGGNDFQPIVNTTVTIRSSTAGFDRCFRIVIVDDSDPDPAENFTISEQGTTRGYQHLH